jgi:hypothetical protein
MVIPISKLFSALEPRLSPLTNALADQEIATGEMGVNDQFALQKS